MNAPDITAALVSDPALIWLVRGIGVATGGALSFWVADFLRLTRAHHGEGRP